MVFCIHQSNNFYHKILFFRPEKSCGSVAYSPGFQCYFKTYYILVFYMIFQYQSHLYDDPGISGTGLNGRNTLVL